ncbi:MAG TPA: FAD/NAD(P)-binding oxidoreductase [Nitriliruptorales bacterium]
MSHVVILGAGFGGLAAATELRAVLPENDRITVVDRRDEFFVGWAKLWDLGGVRSLVDGTRSLRTLGDRGITVERSEVQAIDPQSRTVRTSAGTLEADAVLVALGAGPSPAHRAWLDRDGAHDLYDHAALPAMHEALEAIRSGRVVVAILGGPFKCPPAPYEAALLVDERLRERGVRDDVEVVVVTPQPMTLPAAGVDASRYVASHLDQRGIALREASRVVDVGDGALNLDGGGEIAFDVLLGVPANVAPPVVAPLAGASGWIEPDRHTLATSFDRVYAVGDCTHIPNALGALPMAGVFAAAEGEVAARNILADLGHGDGDRFDGHGHCFLELPGRKVAFVQGDFYADPPAVELTDATDELFAQKMAAERDLLDAWLPVR